MLIEYFRVKGRIKRGVMVAMPNRDLGVIHCGFSLCNTNRDNFDANLGKEIAKNRIILGKMKPIQHSMQSSMKRFKSRCEKYYKGLKAE